MWKRFTLCPFRALSLAVSAGAVALGLTCAAGCDRSVVELHRPEAPNAEFERWHARISELEAEFKEALDIDMFRFEHTGVRRLVNAYDYQLVSRHVRNITTMPLELGWNYYQEMDDFIARYAQLSAEKAFGGLSTANQEILEEYRGKQRAVEDLLKEYQNPSFRWLQPGMKMIYQPFVLSRESYQAGFDYVGAALLSPSLSHASYFSERQLFDRFYSIKNPSYGFCSLGLEDHRDESKRVRLMGTLRVIDVHRRGIISTKVGSGKVWDGLYVTLIDESERILFLACFRNDKAFREFRMNDLQDIAGDWIRFPEMSERVLASIGTPQWPQPMTVEPAQGKSR